MSAEQKPGPWEVVSLLRKPGEPKARCVVRRVVWESGAPQSEYMRGPDGIEMTWASAEEARAAIATHQRTTTSWPATMSIAQVGEATRSTPELLALLIAIVTETMDYPATSRHSGESYLPTVLQERAEQLLTRLGCMPVRYEGAPE